jgi:amidohydrolase
MPTPPYPDYLDRVTRRILAEVADAEPPSSPHEGAPAAARLRVEEAVGGLADDLVGLAHELHAHPELAYEEHESVRRVAELVRGHGHEVEVGAFGVETALRASAGRRGEGPVVAVLAEYDALPGIGHACGHNVIAATAAGAFLALAELGEDLGGEVRLYGCPAEEGGGGKELMARAGAFEDVDAAVMLHPTGFEVAEHPWLGVRTVDVTYHGLSAHASAFPFLGRNALDAAVLAYTGIGQLRQHMLDTDRLHAIITDGGQKPNIVPDRAALSVYIRSAEPVTLAELVDRVRAVLESAGTATGCDVEVDWDVVPVYLPVRNNGPLAAAYARNATARGRMILPGGIVPGNLTGSTDLGNVSVRIPAIHPTIKIAPPGVAIHSPAFAEHAVSEEADRACADGAAILALTALDYLADKGLRSAAAQAFEDAGGVLDLEEVTG